MHMHRWMKPIIYLVIITLVISTLVMGFGFLF
ncbi:stressosome-associated protein Prli42 [Rubeoparvulum massiliense]|nr:stressosome-associated protein Prli42 [Rubeoparvulum massiliense]